ncbi:hypothetical protein [Rhodoferax sp.]|uniref:hypothetical protein n=1 Tax=Rhodoferax sp. TaxID=50421 RepID=UPI002ACD911C|nr:hypothetical protein [Rhodoferax sp.]MDZ7920729.1 hypothetical protein [Rhodoferax sp.]
MSAITTPRLQWIKRRARRLQNYYQITRRLAIYDAWIDWIHFTGAANETFSHL